MLTGLNEQAEEKSGEEPRLEGCEREHVVERLCEKEEFE